MKISLIHHRLGPGGGMERYLADLLAGLSADGDELRVAAQKIKAGWPSGLEIVTEQIRVPALAPRFFKKYFFASRAARWVSRQRAEGRAVIATDRIAGADIMTCGGTHRGHLRRGGSRWRWADNFFEIRRETRAYESARCVVAHSQLVKRELLEFYKLPAERVTVAYPPVDCQRFNLALQNRRAEWRKKFGFDGRKFLLFPSGGHKRKGLNLLLEAVQLLPRDEFVVVIAGARPPGGMPDFVRYLGYVENIEELYAASDAMVLPSRYEPFGLAYVEAWLCGTPVVVPADAGAAEVLPPSAARLREFNAASLSAAILQAVSRPADGDAAFVEQHNLTISGHARELKKILRAGMAGESKTTT